MTPGHKLKEADFIDRLEDLFDVAHALALDMINEPENKEFLFAQREKGRRGVMGSVDQVTVDKLKRARETATKEEKRHQKATEEQEALSCTATLLSSSESDNDTNNESSDIVDKCIPPTSKRAKCQKRAKQKVNMITPGLAAALDRTRMSSRQATYILAEAAKSPGYEVSDVNINRMSIHREREKHRSRFVKELKETYGGSRNQIIC